MSVRITIAQGTWLASGGARAAAAHTGQLVADRDITSFLPVETPPRLPSRPCAGGRAR